MKMELVARTLRCVVWSWGVVILVLISVLRFHGSAAQHTLNYQIPEERATGTVIGTVPLDAMLIQRYNSTVLRDFRYNILQQPNQDKDYFKVEEVTGRIKTARKIDREEVCPAKDDCFLSLDIAISPALYFQVIPVSIEIVDINDHAPSFRDPVIIRNIPESTPEMSGFSLPTAEDPDGPEFSIKQYVIQASPWDDLFGLRPVDLPDGSQDLQLVLRKPLDREDEGFYQIQVEAIDGGNPAKSGTMRINITVGDTNDNHPEFSQTTYNVQVKESEPVGYTIARVEATDRDIGANGLITYKFTSKTQSNYGRLFGLDSETGEVFTRQSLDYEQEDIYHLVVTAEDGGADSRPAYATVVVKVEDVNDNAPQIIINTLTSSPVARISESSPRDTFVAHVSVIDSDSGSNGLIACRLQPHDKFSLEKMPQDQFKVVTKATLDREEEDTFLLTLTCRDKGRSPLTSSQNLTVSVTDANDHSPVFSNAFYSTSIMENNPRGAFLLQVNATDKDIGNNGLIQYEIEDKGPRHLLTISPDTGIIRASQSLDHENVSTLNFVVIARDQGVPQHSASVGVSISIEDENDEPPTFRDINISMGVFENEPAGAEVGGIMAVDRDSEPYNEILYSLEADAEVYRAFQIDVETGAITTRKTLDREERGDYHMRVLASNRGASHLVSTATVTVYVADMNDNDPVVTYPSSVNNTISISSQVPEGYIVTRILADDSDMGINSKLSYTLLSGNEDGHLEIDEDTGALVVAESVFYIDYKIYNLTVRVADHGEIPRSTECHLHVLVSADIMYTGGGDPQSSGRLASGLHSHIVIIVACSSAIVIVILIIAILIIHVKDRRAKALHRYNCRLEAQRMLHTNLPDDREKQTPSPTFHHPPVNTTEFTYQSYLKLNPQSCNSSPMKNGEEKSQGLGPDGLPAPILDGSRRGSLLEGESGWTGTGGGKSGQSWPTALNHAIVQDPQGSSTAVPNQRASPHPGNAQQAKDLAVPARSNRMPEGASNKEPNHTYSTPAHLVYPTGYRCDKLRTGWHKDPDAGSACSGDMSNTDSGKGASEEGEVNAGMTHYKLGTFHSPSDSSENDKHSLSFDSTGSNPLPPRDAKERFHCSHGNSQMLSPRTLSSRSLGRAGKEHTPAASYAATVPSRGDIPLGSFKTCPRTISPARKDTGHSHDCPSVIETDIDTGFHTIRRGPQVPCRQPRPDFSRDSGCYSNGDITRSLDPTHIDKDHINAHDPSFGRHDHSFSLTDNGDSQSVVSSTSGSYVLDPTESLRLKMASLRESTA